MSQVPEATGASVEEPSIEQLPFVPSTAPLDITAFASAAPDSSVMDLDQVNWMDQILSSVMPLPIPHDVDPFDGQEPDAFSMALNPDGVVTDPLATGMHTLLPELDDQVDWMDQILAGVLPPPPAEEATFAIDSRPSVDNLTADYHDVQQYQELLPLELLQAPAVERPAVDPAKASADEVEDEDDGHVQDISDEEGEVVEEELISIVLPVKDSKKSLDVDVASAFAAIADATAEVSTLPATTATTTTTTTTAVSDAPAAESIEAESSKKPEEQKDVKKEDGADDGKDSDFAFSSDDDSDSEDDTPKLTFAQREKLLQSIDANPEDPADAAANLRTKNEVADLPAINPITEPIPADAMLVGVGSVHSTVGDLLIIHTPSDVDQDKALDADTVLVTGEREPIGKIFETFGPVTRPFYSVRFNTAAEVPALPVGTPVFVPRAPGLEKVIFTRALKALKGSDASNIYDEEVGVEEMEFSDDEQEMEYRRNLKAARKRRRPDGDEGEAPPAVPVPDELADSAEYMLNSRPSAGTARGAPRGGRGRGGFERGGGSDRGGGGGFGRGGGRGGGFNSNNNNSGGHDGGEARSQGRGGSYNARGGGSGYGADRPQQQQQHQLPSRPVGAPPRVFPQSSQPSQQYGHRQPYPYSQQATNPYQPQQQYGGYNQPPQQPQQQYQQGFPSPGIPGAPATGQPVGQGYTAAQVAMAALNILQQQQQQQQQQHAGYPGQPQQQQQQQPPQAFDMASMMSLMQGVMQGQGFQQPPQQLQQQQHQQQQQQQQHQFGQQPQPPSQPSAPGAATSNNGAPQPPQQHR
ncbi:hypothetical protein HKX48_002346 [Thoreauomyces humboldtii]|nr:hypothetical protein HKX48_002346 [Thoreauomyces humboldtii]